MENLETSVEIFEKFRWTIENFSKLNVKNIYSEPFVAGGYPWRIILYSSGNNVDRIISIYLEAVKTTNMSEGWSRHAKYKLTVFNQLDSNLTCTRESSLEEFNEHKLNLGYHTFLPLDELDDPEEGFVVKDTCIIGAEVFVSKSTNETQMNPTAMMNVSITSRSQTSHNEVEIPLQGPDVQDPNHVTCLPVPIMVCGEPTKLTDSELFSPSLGELMDFSSVGHQEEICSDSLNEPLPKRRRKFTDLAFSSLGRVIYFLNTRKVKDMNDQACKDLQVLWEEFEKFRFDLTWLEPHVQFALGTKNNFN
ncbi:MATH domain and coiled-coil domain-containing protein At3g58340 [Lathyrus oleraceus]|uniref:MATH domain-containing protein n=1 Tax=Pisum sativum TaxID=3888 RepID=A0A9D5AX21_PEA|nr:MATH domain and coiled-coil domain-containing protein At3g58340-like [Pisum sativum]KAI5425168.1 hypothetical protein KIW84_031103 [Pisum sativum]